MKKILVFLACFFSFSCYAQINGRYPDPPNCPGPLPSTGVPNFCGEFSLRTHCNIKKYYPAKNWAATENWTMRTIYNLMTLDGRRSLEAACATQPPELQGVCVPHWQAYLASCPLDVP